MEFAKTSTFRTGKTLTPKPFRTLLAFAITLVLTTTGLSGCGTESGDEALTKKVYMELVDWHVAGLWIINSPVAWVRVMNYNKVPVKEITFEYFTYDFQGKLLNRGTYTVPDGVVPAGGMKNFIELYLGCVDLNSQQLQVRLSSVRSGSEH